MGRYLWSLVSEVARAVLPIVALLFVLRMILLAVHRQGPTANGDGAFSGTLSLIVGLALVIVGLSGFLKGLDFSLLPLGRNIGSALPQKARLGVIVAFAVSLGALATLAEPDLKVYADQAVGIMGGAIDHTTLMALVAGGAGAGLALGIARIALRIRLSVLLLPMVLLACLLTLTCPKPLNLAAWDIAPVVSGAVTVPLFLALGLGLAAVMGGENPGMAGFGLITLASLGPVVALLIYGTAAVGRSIDPPGASTPDGPVAAAQVAEASEVGETAHDVSAVARETLATAGSVLRVIIPVYAFLIAFQLLVLRDGIHGLRAVFVGLGIIVTGLVLFFQGLEGGFIDLVESVGRILPQAAPSPLLFIPICVLLALVATFAEPAVLVFARQIEEVTAGAIHRTFLLAVLGAGLAFGFGLGILRIWLGAPLPLFLLPVLLVELALTLAVQERYALIAWDAMGVASGTVTVPFFMALGLGIASAVSPEARTAGLGLVMMASVGPVLSVQLVGLIAGRRTT